MATGKRSRSETEQASRLCSAYDDDDDSSTTSASNSGLTIANKRARQSAPIDKFINVVELCEQVLSYLQLYDLLHAMQACRAFKATTDNSHPLQKNLFLAPDRPRSKFAMSPSRTLLSDIRAAQHIATAEAAGKRETGEFTCCTLHPALRLDPKSYRLLWPSKLRKGMVEYAALRYNPPIIVHALDYAVMRDSMLPSTENGANPSSLDGMLITQPPVTSVDVSVVGRSGRDHETCFSDSTSNMAGVTFGDVLRAFAALVVTNLHETVRGWWISFDGRVFVVSAEGRAAAERAGELSSEDDPTRWVLKDGACVLKEGGFEY